MNREAGGEAFSIQEALGVVRGLFPAPPEILVVLGSGLGVLSESLSGAVTVPFRDIPRLPAPGAAGHAGQLVYGTLEGRRVLIQEGRLHLYEGHPMEVVVAPIRIAAALGAGSAILTNAAGGIGRGLVPGDIMLLDDHLDCTGRSPVRGPSPTRDSGPRELTTPYDREYRVQALEVAGALGISLRRGVYAAVLGPSYETPAEIRLLDKAGATAVGMSTVPEAAAARALGLRVLAFSLITNRAAGLGGGTLDHREVLEMGSRSADRMARLVRGILPRIR